MRRRPIAINTTDSPERSAGRYPARYYCPPGQSTRSWRGFYRRRLYVACESLTNRLCGSRGLYDQVITAERACDLVDDAQVGDQ
ncbi:hypothetical protein Pa4123_57330 [Phytohabitans aurantiacus]|uniref:Uncharacterized protein n=1 Tax=Phytohabitans aurantiacus TaxID=3016789 RepID=A0ABQ5R2N0_9ACTN|nr:hypothetical protein Pa4123_57330 [Phytohabitans aurantiacus]